MALATIQDIEKASGLAFRAVSLMDYRMFEETLEFVRNDKLKKSIRDKNINDSNNIISLAFDVRYLALEQNIFRGVAETIIEARAHGNQALKGSFPTINSSVHQNTIRFKKHMGDFSEKQSIIDLPWPGVLDGKYLKSLAKSDFKKWLMFATNVLEHVRNFEVIPEAPILYNSISSEKGLTLAYLRALPPEALGNGAPKTPATADENPKNRIQWPTAMRDHAIKYHEDTLGSSQTEQFYDKWVKACPSGFRDPVHDMVSFNTWKTWVSHPERYK